MSGCEIDIFFEERFNDIDEFIQFELGYVIVIIMVLFIVLEIYNVSVMLEKEGMLSGLCLNILLGECIFCLFYVLILWSIVFLVQKED